MPKSDRWVLAGCWICCFVLGLLWGVPVGAQEIAYDSGKRRDPFIPLSVQAGNLTTAPSGLKLEGIIYDPGRQSMAILSGASYQVGEYAGEALVKSIQKTSVVIVSGGEEKTLWIRDDERPPEN